MLHQFETLQRKYLHFKYTTKEIEHEYKAYAHVTRALYMHTSVIVSVNITVAIQEIELCIELMRNNPHYDYLLPVYTEAIKELKRILDKSEYW